MCCICRAVRPKSQLWRLQVSDQGLKPDRTGKADGRGTYVCRNAACIERLGRRKFRHAHVDAQTVRELLGMEGESDE